MSTPHSHAQAVAAIGAAARAWASWHSRRYKSGNARVRTRDRDSWIAKVTGLVPEDWWDKWTAEQQAGFVRDMSAIKAKFDAEQRPIGSAPLSLVSLHPSAWYARHLTVCSSQPSPTEETCSRTLFRMRRVRRPLPHAVRYAVAPTHLLSSPPVGQSDPVHRPQNGQPLQPEG